MSLTDLANALLRAGQRLLDTDGDGKLELSDAPGAIEKLAQVVTAGDAMVASGRAALEALLAAARAGKLQENGVDLTANDVIARWRASRAGFIAAADRVRAEQGGDGQTQ